MTVAAALTRIPHGDIALHRYEIRRVGYADEFAFQLRIAAEFLIIILRRRYGKHRYAEYVEQISL